MKSIIDDQVYAETHDNVATNIFSRTMPINGFVTVFIKGSAIRQSNGDAKVWNIAFTCKRRAASPVLSTVTNIFTPVSDAGASAWTLAPVLNGNDVELRATGQSAADVYWNFKIVVLITLDNT